MQGSDACEKEGLVSDEWIGHSRGGRTTKIHLCANGKARPLAIVVTAGQRNDATHMEPVLDAIHVPQRRGPTRKRAKRLRMDRAYRARKSRKVLCKRRIQCIGPKRKDARKARLSKGSCGGRPPALDAEAYTGRNVVERCINRLKDFQAVSTRYDKRGHNYLAGVLVALIMLWL